MFISDTIAAPASSMNSAGIGIIRISGSESIRIADEIYRGKKRLAETESHTVSYGHIVESGNQIDEVMVLVMRGPKTYTTEDTVEIDCHGGLLVMEKILECVYRHGARPAEPGEFTKRAFLNGRIDLSQAESVMDVISSKNEFALKNSMNQLHGSVRRLIEKYRSDIIYEIAFIESALDDPEHISLDGYGDSLFEKTETILSDLSDLLVRSSDGIILKEGIYTAIVGKPNAGKSSLLNVLAGKERAIVTEIAGTTRDTLEEQIMVHGISLNIIDTAGIRNTTDVVERIGVDRARDCMASADLILFVADASVPLDENDIGIMRDISDKNVIVLLNKCDLDIVTDKRDILQYLDKDIISFSAKESVGLEQLEDKIKEMFFHGKISVNDEVYITNSRQKYYLTQAKISMEHVRDSIKQGMPEDFYSIDLMDAYENLGYVIGESVEEDLVNEIFGKFCMGK